MVAPASSRPPKSLPTRACDPKADIAGLLKILSSNKPISSLLIFCPIGAMAKPVLGLSAVGVFSLNFLAIIPLAWVLGEATETLALHVGETLGGLLNATFGNAVEMIMSVFALQAGLVTVVQGSLLGSILSNLLLVLGMCFAAGGYYYKEQSFNVTAAQANSTMLLVAATALALPTVFSMTVSGGCEAKALNMTTTFEQTLTSSIDCQQTADDISLQISRYASLLLGAVYVQYLAFQLLTHGYLFADAPAEPSADGQAEEEEEEECLLTKGGAVTMLVIATLLVSLNSECLVGSIEGLTVEADLSQNFVGVILLPIVGNAAEHLTAVTSAVKNKMNLAIGVAVGSSTQIALCVVPFTVIAGWVMHVDMSLDFHPFSTVTMLLAVLIVNVVLADGHSNWLEGSLLMTGYVLIGLCFWFLR
eukprot:SAG31_NODE_2653_length_5296_cov_2.690591_3_plen_419_part_00